MVWGGILRSGSVLQGFGLLFKLRSWQGLRLTASGSWRRDFPLPSWLRIYHMHPHAGEKLGFRPFRKTPPPPPTGSFGMLFGCCQGRLVWLSQMSVGMHLRASQVSLAPASAEHKDGRSTQALFQCAAWRRRSCLDAGCGSVASFWRPHPSPHSGSHTHLQVRACACARAVFPCPWLPLTQVVQYCRVKRFEVYPEVYPEAYPAALSKTSRTLASDSPNHIVSSSGPCGFRQELPGLLVGPGGRVLCTIS